MKGHNHVWVSGNVGGKISTGFTRDNKPACSFFIASEDVNRGTTWVRVNAYGALALRIQPKLVKGTYLSVVGELMNRKGKNGEMTEVRARDVVLLPSSADSAHDIPQKEDDDGEGTEPEWTRKKDSMPELRQ